MMRGSTMVWFIWKTGESFAKISRQSVEYFSRREYHLEKLSSLRNVGAFRIATSDVLSCIDSPWENDPWPKQDTSDISWHILTPQGAKWGNFYVKREQNLSYFQTGQTPNKVYVMLLFFDGRLWSHCGESEAEFEAMVEKYNRIKELFRALDCDEVIAWDEYYIYDYAWQAKFPFHRDKLFRFAKEGTQVLVKRMEERRMLPPVDWLHSRIFIDPPSVQGLSPEEYSKPKM